MNYQSKQAIRVLYGESHSRENLSNKYNVCSVYGPTAVLKSNGAHPLDLYKVFPILPEIKNMARLLISFVKKMGLAPDSVVGFNFLEIKIYIDNDIFLSQTEEDELI